MSLTSTHALRFGIIGCGRMGRLHADRISRDGGGSVAACCDLDRASAENLAAETGATVMVGWQDVINASDVAAVVISTPTTEHHDQAIAALSAGKHVLCEKPLADTRERIENLIAAANRADAKSMLAYQRRFSSAFRALRREVQGGEHGTVRAVSVHSTERWQQTIASTWRDDPAVNIGGFMGDAGSHKMDLVFHVTGLALTDVFARSQRCGSRVEVVTSVSGLLAGDVPLTMDFIGNAQFLGEDFSVHCERADLMVRDGRCWIARDNVVQLVDDAEPESNPVAGFIDYIEGMIDNPVPFSSALPVFDFMSAVQASARMGVNVKLA